MIHKTQLSYFLDLPKKEIVAAIQAGTFPAPSHTAIGGEYWTEKDLREWKDGYKLPIVVSSDGIIRRNRLAAFLGMNKPDISKLINAGKFAQPIYLRTGEKVWMVADVARWKATEKKRSEIRAMQQTIDDRRKQP